MDHLSRLIVWFVVFVCPCAFADTVPSSPGWQYSGQNTSTIYASASDAAYGRGAQYCGSSCTVTSAVCTSSCSAATQGWRINLSNGGFITNSVSQSGSLCPSNSTLSGGSCTCAAGYQALNGQCVQPCDDNKERDESGVCGCKSIASAGSFMVPGDEYQGCNNGCLLGLDAGWYDKTANVTWGHKWHQSPQACGVGVPNVVSPTDPKVEAAKQCEAGSCPGTVNGQSVCVPCDKTKQTQTTTSSTSAETTASGATSGTTTTSSDTETTRTECKDGTCTTTTTSTSVGADGTAVDKTSTKTEPQSDYCTQNPKAEVCKGTESSWGGTCSAFTCDGDAVTCAIAQASWKSACALDIEPTDSKVTAGNAALGAGDRPPGHPALNPDTSSFSANLDTSNPYGSECPMDIPLQVLGQQFEIPLSTACGSLRFMGQIAVAFALLAAAYIVFGGVKG